MEFTKNMGAYEGFENFLQRIYSFEKPDFKFGVDVFCPNGSITNKVESNGAFSLFVGDTVVFNLDQTQKKVVFEKYIEPLYKVAPYCFAEKLREQTLHMTLHDLNATRLFGCDHDTMCSMFSTEIEIYRLIEWLKTEPQTINMVTTCAFNMVNTSMVLGLRPKTEEDYEKLMHCYCYIERIKSLPYLFTPHITLAYFNRYSFDSYEIRRIEEVINHVNQDSLEIPLSTESLFYQKFTGMNTYFDILPFVKY